MVGLGGADDLDFLDELLDEGLALGGYAAVQDGVDVVGECVEFAVGGHCWGVVEQVGEFVAACLT